MDNRNHFHFTHLHAVLVSAQYGNRKPGPQQAMNASRGAETEFQQLLNLEIR